jgi:FtsP/CotA-like multicopper oxidase with cupredoxin domain
VLTRITVEVLNLDVAERADVIVETSNFEVSRIGDKPTSGVIKDTLSMPRFSSAEVDFVADNPGATLFHCHD